MIDSFMRRLIDPQLDRTARLVARLPVEANTVSYAGLALGAVAAIAIVMGAHLVALIAIMLNRLADGLDGALARVRGPTPLGGYIDIVFDFLFYGAVPLAFALADPAANALPAAVLLASFYANGATFLAFSAIAAEKGLSTDVQGKKSIYYFAGVAEGTETIATFCLMVLFPESFAWIAYAFAALCFVSAGARIIAVHQTLR